MDPNGTEGLFNEPVEDNDSPDQNQDVETDHLAELVGEGKKFKDVNALAKGKHESDVFVTKLQKEMAELRKELSTRLSMEEFLEKTKGQLPKNDSPTPEPNEQDKRGVPVSPEDIKTLIKTTLTEEQQRRLSAQNLDSVRKTLESTWGRDFPYKLREKARDLNLSEKYLEDMAASHPNAFLKLVGVEKSASEDTTSFAPPPSSARPPADRSSGNKNFAHYEKIRKENPRLYFSPSVQNEMFEQAKRQGEGFYRK